MSKTFNEIQYSQANPIPAKFLLPDGTVVDELPTSGGGGSRPSLDWNNAVETVATNTNENTFNVTTDGVLFYDLAGFYGNNCYVKINDITIAFGSSNGNVWVVSKTGSCIVSEGDVIKWKEGYVGDWMSTHKIVFVPYK